MELIHKNMVLQYITKDEKLAGERFRIIWISDDGKFAFIINISYKTVMPKMIYVKEIEMEVACGNIRETDDLFCIQIDEDSIPENYKIVRDRKKDVIDYLWNREEPEVLMPNRRGKVIKEASKKFKVSVSQIERDLSRFWQLGMNINALLPMYSNSGGRGKERVAGKMKRGRPRNHIEIDNGETLIGINTDEETKQIMRVVIDTFYRKKEKPSLKETYQHMLQKFFSTTYISNKSHTREIYNQNKIPSYTQFYNFYKKYSDEDKSVDIIKRYSDKEFQLKHRELLGSSTQEAYGPGSKFQIDATIGDIYLVSKINNSNIIGRPVIYAVVDVYSRLITGIYVGIEGPSWIGAMMALYNTASNKVDFCKRYDIDIEEDEWPCSVLPECILADRGEFEGYNVNNLVNNLGIKIENTAPYRGDLKGIVERNFRTINEKIKHTTPGAIQKQFRERGDRDYRLDATLNIEDFTKIIIHSVLYHNKHMINGYIRERGLIEDGVPSIPTELWKWGVKNRTSRWISKPEDILLLNLLPRGNALISRKGIVFKSLYYSAEKAIEEQWFIDTKNRESREIVYDPRNMDYIYIPELRGIAYTKCFLLEKSHSFKSLSLEEIVFQQESESEFKKLFVDQDNQQISDYEKSIESVIKAAKERKKLQGTSSNEQKIKSIRANRSEEKNIIREDEKIELNSKENPEMHKPQDSGLEAQKICAGSESNTINFLKKMRDEMLNEKGSKRK